MGVEAPALEGDRLRQSGLTEADAARRGGPAVVDDRFVPGRGAESAQEAA